MQASPLITKFYETAKEQSIAIIQSNNGESISYKELHLKSDRLAVGLVKNGFSVGDRILLLVRPGIDAVVCVLAALKAGGCIVIADPGTGNELFRERIKEASPDWTFIDPLLNRLSRHHRLLKWARMLDKSIPDLEGVKLPRPIICSTHNNTKSPTITSLSSNNNEPIRLPNLQPSQEAIIVFTSGTTSKPKGVVHTHKTLASSLTNIEKLLSVSKPRLYTSQPYFLLLGIGVGAEVIINSRSFNPKRFLRDSQKYKPNLIFGPPGEFLPLIAYCQRYNKKFPSSYEQVLFGSAPVAQAFLKKFYQIASLKLETQCIYGMTEAIPIATISGRDKLEWQGSGDVLGSLAPGITINIDKAGELAVSGPNVMPHYLNKQPEKYIKTGDIVQKDKQNLLVLKGRKKDMILRRSYNIYPSLYEPTISKIPGINDVALIGIYDDRIADEKVILVVELEPNVKLSASDIYKALTQSTYSIDANALPDEIQFRHLPRAGRQLKVDKQALRKDLRE